MITGAGQGLGRAMAERFALEGAALALCDINRIAVEETARACAPARASAPVVDVADGTQVTQ